jgi:CBS domain-containing protein
MPYQVQQILKGKGYPVCVQKDDPVSKALSLMIEHDYSQLPVVTTQDNDLDFPEGIITYEGILRGIRNFNTKIEALRVRDVMMSAPIYNVEDDLFDILDRLKETNAVLVMHGDLNALVGIVTSYDTAEYFRNHTEDLMRVEDIELMVKDFIRLGYTLENGELDEARLDLAIAKATEYANKEGTPNTKKKTFADLTLSEYITILIKKETWSFYEPIFKISRDALNGLLCGVRDIRNALAHFRGDISAEQRDKLKFCAEWLSGRQEDYQTWKEQQEKKRLLEMIILPPTSAEAVTPSVESTNNAHQAVQKGEFSVSEPTAGGGRYGALADWLQRQPGRIDQVQLTFNQIEEIINADLPLSARKYRAWWANDSVGHSHSQAWLDAGWRTTSINLSEGKVTFGRIVEREKAYIAFFSKLLDELHAKNFNLKNVSPDGTSWVAINTLPRSGGSYGKFCFSFTRDKRLRVELYLDLPDQDQTKAVFDLLIAQKDPIEAQVGAIQWERLDLRRASRIALYHAGQISEEENHVELRTWAAETMVKFVNAIQKPAEQALAEVLKRS